MDYDGLDTFRFPPNGNADPSFVLKVAKALVAMAKQDHLAGTDGGQQTLMYLAKKETGIMLKKSQGLRVAFKFGPCHGTWAHNVHFKHLEAADPVRSNSILFFLL